MEVCQARSSALFRDEHHRLSFRGIAGWPVSSVVNAILEALPSLSQRRAVRVWHFLSFLNSLLP
jgi:hypothetical protein